MQHSRNSIRPAQRALKLATGGIAEVYASYGVPYISTEARGGWISTHCPFCVGSADYHLGFNVVYSYFRCWRCGHHNAVDALVSVCHIDRGQAASLYQAIRSNPGIPSKVREKRDEAVQSKIELSRFRYPSDVWPMGRNHRHYLEKRNFDPDKIAEEWRVMGTGPISRMDKIDYRHRLLIPIHWDNKPVSFQTRDITGKSDRKYIACPADRETKHHKHIVYGDQSIWGDAGIVVEGVTDVWRLGKKACAVFGIQYCTEQVRLIAKQFRRVAIIFDAERQAQLQAQKLSSQLRLMNVETNVVNLEGYTDPGSMSQDDAYHLVNDLI